MHAYLHRVEGDENNAGYWYRRAGKPHSSAPRAEEWQEIVTVKRMNGARALGSDGFEERVIGSSASHLTYRRLLSLSICGSTLTTSGKASRLAILVSARAIPPELASTHAA